MRVPDRIGFALRASELVDLALAGRIEVDGRRITVTGQAPTGNPRLDGALAVMRSDRTAPTIESWLHGTPRGNAMAGKYLSVLRDQRAVRVEQMRHTVQKVSKIIVLDTARRDSVLARIGRVARGRPAPAPDVALAGLVSACHLDRRLYRGPLGWPARRRLAHAAQSGKIIAGAEGMVDPLSAEAAEAVAKALSDGIARLTEELQYVMRHDYQIEHSAGGYGHHSHSDTGGHHDAGGYGGGHH